MSFLCDGSLGLCSYIEALQDPETIDSIIHNLTWVLIHLPASIMLGLFFALLLQWKIKGASLIKAIIFSGMVIPMIVGGLLIRFSFEKGVGIVPQLFRLMGVPSLYKTWTAYPDIALYALIIGSVWLWTGFNMVVFSAGLAAIPKEYIEAAMVDGASKLQVFLRIILPLLKPSLTIALLTTFIYELKIFDIVYVATQGGPGDASMVLALLVYFFGFREYNLGKAAAVAVLLVMISLVPAVQIAKLTTAGAKRG